MSSSRFSAFFLAIALAIASSGRAEVIPGHYVVELTMPGVIDAVAPESVRGAKNGRIRAVMASPEAESHRRALHAGHASLRTRLEARNARVLGSVDTVANAVFVEMAGDAVEAQRQIAALPGVKRVMRAREFHRVMDRAVAVNRIADAWAQIGAGRGGEGIKVAVIDTGVEVSHPAFQDPSLTPPDGFPRASTEADTENTNGKVIVARSYVSLLSRRDPDLSARDRVGHGTALAAIIAGVRTAGPLATVAGVAPKAFVGSYKVFGSPGVNNGASDAAILTAIDDAVKDGMDVINLSLGSDLAPRLEEDPEVSAIERATRAGVIVVVSAGNNGPALNTLASPGTAPSAITVGAVSNERIFAASVEVPSVGAFMALTGSGPKPAAPLTARILDAETFDKNGLACGSLPAGSLTGAAVLILRGSCTFETKLNNAQLAGAVAAVVYATEQSPSAISMDVGAATLPGEMVSNSAGIAIKQAIRDQALVATLRFTVGPLAIPPGRRSDFSAAGPNVDVAIKPDLVAVGSSVYVPTQTLDSRGDMFSADGFVLVNGTSFSAPIVAGAVALIKSARPGLTTQQYRSLIINTAAEAVGVRGEASTIQQTGAGMLDAQAALNSTVTASPSMLSFGAGASAPQIRRSLALSNLGTSTDTFAIETDVRAGSSGVPSFPGSVSIAAGGTVDVPLVWESRNLEPGPYEGFVIVRSTRTGSAIRIPYWYAVKGGSPAGFTVLSTATGGVRGSMVRNAVRFRVVDAAGLNVDGADPQVTVVEGDGTARPVTSLDSEIPGVFSLTVQLGPLPGSNTFRIQAGQAAMTVTLAGR